MPHRAHPWRNADYTLAFPLRRLRGMPRIWRLAERLRRAYARRWAGTDAARVTIPDFDGDLAFALDRSTHIGSAISWHGHHSGGELHVLDRLLRSDMVFVVEKGYRLEPSGPMETSGRSQGPSCRSSRTSSVDLCRGESSLSRPR